MNLVNNYSLEEWEEILLNDSPDTKNSLICLHPAAPHHVAGYIMLHPIDGQQYEAGWVGLSGEAEPIMLQRLLKKQLENLKNKGVEWLELEVDTTDKYAMDLFNFVEFENYEAWKAYILR